MRQKDQDRPGISRAELLLLNILLSDVKSLLFVILYELFCESIQKSIQTFCLHNANAFCHQITEELHLPAQLF